MLEEEYSQGNKFDLKEWKKIFRFLIPFKNPIIILLAASVATAFFDAAFPLMTKYAINNFIQTKSMDGLVGFTLIFILFAALQGWGSIIYSRKAIFIEMGVGRDMRYELFRHTQNLSVDYFNNTPVGFILARIMNDTNSMGGMFSWRLASIAFNMSYLAFIIISMAALSPVLALIVFVIIAILAVITWHFQKKLLGLNRKARKQNSKLTASYNENINGAQTIKSLGIETPISKEFEGVNQGMRQRTMKVQSVQRIFYPLISSIGSMSVAIVVAAAVPMIADLVIDLGTLAVFISYTFSILGPIEELTDSFNNTISLQANVERVNKLMDTQPTINDDEVVKEKYGDIYHPKKENWEPIVGDIEFENVSFRYPDSDNYVLENFNLKIKAGTSIAIVGQTGAGKSTLVNLICRFFEPTSGRILIDGTDYKNRSLLWLESNLSYVLQSPHLFSGTIEENIKYSNPAATYEQVVAAAKKAQAHSFIEKLTEGYKTQVGQGGDKLSTGQKQLISIARALLADGKILVMDEATSSVDTQTEQLINGITNTILQGKTSFIIAHRLSTVKNADIIIVVDEGKIIEMGSHRQLLQKQGHYYELYTSQWEEQEQTEFFEKIKTNNLM